MIFEIITTMSRTLLNPLDFSLAELAQWQKQYAEDTQKRATTDSSSSLSDDDEQTCSAQTSEANCKRYAPRCFWKPLTLFQGMTAHRLFRHTHTACKQDEEYLSHFVLELASYGKHAIVGKRCILFPNGFHPEMHRNEVKYPIDHPEVLQQYILPDIKVKVVDAILSDLIASYSRVSKEAPDTTYQVAQIEALNMTKKELSHELDLGSKLAILYLFFRTREMDEQIRGCLVSLQDGNMPFFDELKAVDIVMNFRDSSIALTTSVKHRAQWSAASVISTAIVTFLACVSSGSLVSPSSDTSVAMISGLGKLIIIDKDDALKSLRTLHRNHDIFEQYARHYSNNITITKGVGTEQDYVSRPDRSECICRCD